MELVVLESRRTKGVNQTPQILRRGHRVSAIVVDSMKRTCELEELAMFLNVCKKDQLKA